MNPLLPPSGFTMSDLMHGGLEMACTRNGCTWRRTLAGGVHLTELYALAVEHVEEHR